MFLRTLYACRLTKIFDIFTTNPTTRAMTDPVFDSSAVTERTAEYPIYKPNARGTGGVVRFGLNVAKASLFVDAANQSGEKQFDWENKITMKWGLSDIGTVIALLQGRVPQAKLFHRAERANSAFELILGDHATVLGKVVAVLRAV